MSLYHIHVREEAYTPESRPETEREILRFLNQYSGTIYFASTLIPIVTVKVDDNKAPNPGEFMSELEKTLRFIEKVERAGDVKVIQQ